MFLQIFRSLDMYKKTCSKISTKVLEPHSIAPYVSSHKLPLQFCIFYAFTMDLQNQSEMSVFENGSH